MQHSNGENVERFNTKKKLRKRKVHTAKSKRHLERAEGFDTTDYNNETNATN